MRMKKRTVTTFIAILGILGVLSGCGGRETAAAPEAPQAAETVTAAAPVTEEPVITPDEGTLAKYLVGIRDRNVLKGAREHEKPGKGGSLYPGASRGSRIETCSRWRAGK